MRGGPGRRRAGQYGIRGYRPAAGAGRGARGEHARAVGRGLDLFIRGSDNALWMNVRAPGAAAWRGWHRIGGYLTSAPVANIWPSSFLGKVRTVLFLGRHGNLRVAQNAVGTRTWTWGEVP